MVIRVILNFTCRKISFGCRKIASGPVGYFLTSLCACTYIRMYMFVCMHACMYVCVYVCISVWIAFLYDLMSCYVRKQVVVSVLVCQSRGSGLKSWPGQKFGSRFLFHLHPLANSAMMSTLTVHCHWEDETVR